MNNKQEILLRKLKTSTYTTKTYNIRSDQHLKLKEIAHKTNVPVSKYLRACLDTLIELYETNQL